MNEDDIKKLPMLSSGNDVDSLLKIVNWGTGFAYLACLSYQAVFLFAPWFRREKTGRPEGKHHFAVLISARNEESVVTQLIESIHRQTYTGGKIDVYLVADNCTDRTAACAEKAGAHVLERSNTKQTGKGYALDHLVEHMRKTGVFSDYDAFLIFDADNILKEDFVEEINKTFSQGYPVLTSCRSSKNFTQNWISCASGLWFMHDAQHSNGSRMMLGTNCMVNGTGFLVAREVLEKAGGWKFHQLTEDIEFNAWCILNEVRSGYCEKAVFFDEQPVRTADTWNQRLRWVKGYYQVMRRYGKELFFAVFKRNGFSFAAVDMLMASLPSFILFIIAFGFYLSSIGFALFTGRPTKFAILSVFRFYAIVTGVMFGLGAYTMAVERDKIQIPGRKKWLYCLMFAFYMEQFIPIAVAALFKDVHWKPIRHSAVSQTDKKSLETTGRIRKKASRTGGRPTQKSAAAHRHTTQHHSRGRRHRRKKHSQLYKFLKGLLP